MPTLKPSLLTSLTSLLCVTVEVVKKISLQDLDSIFHAHSRLQRGTSLCEGYAVRPATKFVHERRWFLQQRRVAHLCDHLFYSPPLYIRSVLRAWRALLVLLIIPGFVMRFEQDGNMHEQFPPWLNRRLLKFLMPAYTASALNPFIDYEIWCR